MKPILFNTEMVCAILADCKTMTRRVVKPQPKFAMTTSAGLLISDSPITIEGDIVKAKLGSITTWDKLPYRPGDILYVRETWSRISDWTDVDPAVGLPDGYIYKADWRPDIEHPKWRPSRYMPREAARIFLRVTDVRVERLRSMLPCDIQKEGCPYTYSGFDEEDAPDWEGWMKNVWNSTTKKSDRALYGWNANPWVWVISFERISREEAYCCG